MTRAVKLSVSVLVVSLLGATILFQLLQLLFGARAEIDSCLDRGGCWDYSNRGCVTEEAKPSACEKLG